MKIEVVKGSGFGGYAFLVDGCQLNNIIGMNRSFNSDGPDTIEVSFLSEGNEEVLAKIL